MGCYKRKPKTVKKKSTASPRIRKGLNPIVRKDEGSPAQPIHRYPIRSNRGKRSTTSADCMFSSRFLNWSKKRNKRSVLQSKGKAKVQDGRSKEGRKKSTSNTLQPQSTTSAKPGHTRKRKLADRKNFPCQYCSRQYVSARAADNHMYTYHFDAIPKSVIRKSGKLICSFCRGRYVSQRTLVVHLTKMHPDIFEIM